MVIGSTGKRIGESENVGFWHGISSGVLMRVGGRCSHEILLSIKLIPTYTTIPRFLLRLFRNMASFNTEQTRWLAVQKRDPNAHSSFIYAVITTKIYCRPTCPARLARRANVRFYDGVAEAVAAGFRPCKRCKPDVSGEQDLHRSAEIISQACKIIDDVDGEVVILEVAKSLGLSVRHLHNLFKDAMGYTPAVYAANVRQLKQAQAISNVAISGLYVPEGDASAQLSNGTFHQICHSNGSPASLTNTETSWPEGDVNNFQFQDAFEDLDDSAAVLNAFDFELASLPPISASDLMWAANMDFSMSEMDSHYFGTKDQLYDT